MVHHLDIVAWCDVVIACYLNSHVNSEILLWVSGLHQSVHYVAFYCYKYLYKLHHKSAPDGTNFKTKIVETLVKFVVSLRQFISVLG